MTNVLYCLTCKRTSMIPDVLPAYRTTRWHDGREFPVELHNLLAFRCPECKTVRLPQESSDRIERQFELDRDLPTPDEVRACRERHHWTAAELASAIGVREEDVNGWEAGRTFPSTAASARFSLLQRQSDEVTSQVEMAASGVD